MKQSTKAALFSALIFPGSGHLLLKRYPVGILLVCTVLGCLGVLINRAIVIAQMITDKMLSGEIPLDAEGINAAINAQSAASESLAVTIATWLLVAAWVLGSIDAWRLGRRADEAREDDAAT
jgi:hypothetical protein